MNAEKANESFNRQDVVPHPLENVPSFDEHMRNFEQMPKLKGEDGKTLQAITDKISFPQLDSLLSESVRLSEIQELDKKPLGDIVSDFRKRSNVNTKSMMVGKEVCEHVRRLGQDGKIGVDTAKIWLTPDLIVPPMGTSAAAEIYEAIEERGSNERVSNEKQDYIREAILKLAQHYPKKDVEVQGQLGMSPVENAHSILGQKEGFVHFNDKKQGNGVDMRCYISLNPGKRDRALKVWHETLVESGAKDSLYYKVGITDKHIDDIVIYRSDEIPDDILKKTLSLFSEKSLAEGLIDASNEMATGRKIADGIMVAPETKYVNNYLKSMDLKKYSYNQFIARMVELSACVASTRMENGQLRYADTADGVNNGKMHSTKDPNFRREMRGVFREFMQLSKINPDTMLPIEYGDELPTWAKLKTST